MIAAQPPQSALKRAAEHVRRALPPDGSPWPSRRVQDAAAALTPPIPARTVQRAAKVVGVIVTQESTPDGRITLWALPEPVPARRPPEVASTDPARPAVRRGTLGERAKTVLHQYRREIVR
ncbi:hypothetical protein [Mycobacterium paragordonae]|uniref:Uncharacterized protein n=1 Tax=Mycobacterium paragordonae TaxID=1389713 RepID=A0ABQ1C3Z8_9MYCO|nr:hypothetical protein [Mycobacterium paragordonae]GFG78984.1 hypothetical protein MPRG_22600 [Mycobacterium paragordonae]